MTSSASIATGGSDLAAELTLPDGRGPHPAIVPLHPASERSRDQLLFRHLAEALSRHGVAVLRYDRRGDDVPLADQVADANAAVETLRARPDIDARRIGLWGFSQGAWVAPMAAAASDRIAFLVLLASTGVSPAEQMRYGTIKHARQAGYGDDVAARILEVRAALEEFERGRRPRDAAQRAVDAVAGEPWFEHAYVRRELPDAPGFWPDMDFDPAAVFAQVRVPTLLFYGQDDEWQPIDASIAAWRKSGVKDLTIVRLAGTGHAPTTRTGEISNEYERTMLVWLDERVRAKA